VSTELACASDDDLLLTGGDRPGSEQNGDEERENGNGERGEGLHCWGARERGWAMVQGWEDGDKLRKSARKQPQRRSDASPRHTRGAGFPLQTRRVVGNDNREIQYTLAKSMTSP